MGKWWKTSVITMARRLSSLTGNCCPFNTRSRPRHKKQSEVIRSGIISFMNPPPEPSSSAAPSIRGREAAMEEYHSSYIFFRNFFFRMIWHLNSDVCGSSIFKFLVRGWASHDLIKSHSSIEPFGYWVSRSSNKLDPPRSKHDHLKQQPAMFPATDVRCSIRTLTVPYRHFHNLQVQFRSTEQ